jgi:folate-binding protein YgfZ
MAIGEAIGSHNFENGPARFGTGAAEHLPGEWRAVLERSGARFDPAGITDFGQADAEGREALSADVMADLSHCGLIEARGEDARKFLASLFTGDLRLMSPERGLFTAWCDARGRAQATFWLFMHGDAYYLLLPRDIVEPVLAGLKRYLLRVKANLRDASGSLLRLGLSGPGMESRLAAFLGAPPPGQVGETRTFGGCTLMAIAGHPFPRWLAVGHAEAVIRLWVSLIPAILPVGRNAWTLLDVLAGIPLLVSETAGEFIPQMLNMEALGGLCFTKGCYPGQEVIARLHYRGQLKRRLYLAYVDSEQIPPPGARLYIDAVEESAGTVVSAARHPGGEAALLCVVKTEEKTQGEVRLRDAQGPELRFVE